MNTLQTEAVKARLGEKGLSQTALAEALGVSKESVSKWLRGEAMPRPDKLLRMALTLGLSRAQLLGVAGPRSQPEVAFRMSRGKAPANSHLERAQHMGKMLEALVPHLPFDSFKTPPELKEPRTDYEYLARLAEDLRRDMGVAPEGGPINISTLAASFKKLQAVIVPVLWGHRKNHENAIHIYLPQSTTTWVYLNLDTRMCDLRFWLAHELGHTYTFSRLKGEEGEDFADAFAGALLVPKPVAQGLYRHLAQLSKSIDRFKLAEQAAADLEISPVCVAKQIERYADAHGQPRLFDGDKLLYQMFEKSRPPSAASKLLPGEHVEFTALMDLTADVFHSPFYDALKAFLAKNGSSAGFVQGLLDCSLFDAKQICSELA